MCSITGITNITEQRELEEIKKFKLAKSVHLKGALHEGLFILKDDSLSSLNNYMRSDVTSSQKCLFTK